MTTHILSMTYQPKIEGIRNGTIRQTIRLYNEKRPFKVGDKLLIHGWEGRPYRSKWSWRMDPIKVLLTTPIDCTDNDFRVLMPASQMWARERWEDLLADGIAKDDGIAPPKGFALKIVLERYHGKFTDKPVRFQVIRW